MIREKSTKPAESAVPPAVAEDAILRNIEQGWRLAEGLTQVDAELRHQMIATAAYLIAEQRGFIPGHETQDWYAAEAAIDKELTRVLARD